jgi:site-specific DNA-methyltransferase (adenine-specific)
MEDAGLEIRDCFSWLYSNGFPKNHNVAKSLEEASGGTPELVGVTSNNPRLRPNAHMANVDFDRPNMSYGAAALHNHERRIYAYSDPLARAYEGYGTALKPSWEPALLARVPLEGSVAANIMKYGVGALNIPSTKIYAGEKEGRFPANVVLDDTSAKMLDEAVGILHGSGNKNASVRAAKSEDFVVGYGSYGGDRNESFVDNEGGPPSRFYYCAKASSKEREMGLDSMRDNVPYTSKMGEAIRVNDHPTAKPIDLARYLASLMLPPPRLDGKPRRILVPYSGVGSEMIGCMLAGWDEVYGIEIDPHYVEIALKRLEYWKHDMEENTPAPSLF